MLASVTPFFATAFLAVAAMLVFQQVAKDYEKHRTLRPFSTLLEVLIFALHGVASYFYLDSNLGTVGSGPLTYLAVSGMALGLVFTLAAMLQLGLPAALGRQVGGLRQTGFYRYSRNPQIIFY